MDGAAALMDETTYQDDASEESASEPRGDVASEEAGFSARGDGETTERPAPAPQEIHPHRIVEAVLMAADSPHSAGKIAGILGVGTARDVKKHIERLNNEYDEAGMSIRIEELAGGYQILTRPEYNTWLAKLLRVRQETKLSPAAMETLSIVAYKQPCTRADIETVRGVAAGDMLNRLREMNLIKIVGRAEDIGRPILYGTTKKFLEVFGLPSLEDLPRVEALRSGGSPTTETPRNDVDSLPATEGDDTEGRNIPFPVQPDASIEAGLDERAAASVMPLDETDEAEHDRTGG